MGESITEATVINWLVQPGDFIAAEQPLVEVATDKVDNEVPAPCSGIIKELRFQKNDVVPVGEVIAIIDPSESGDNSAKSESKPIAKLPAEAASRPAVQNTPGATLKTPRTDVFLSPLIVSIAQKENISLEELQLIPGSGTGGRLRKSDVFQYLKNRKYPVRSVPQPAPQPASTFPFAAPQIAFDETKDRLVEMDRMRKIIAGHMVYSKQTSPHVTSYLEVDVTGLVAWRERTKDEFQQEFGQKLTFTPVFVQAVARALVDFPMMNVSVDGDRIVVRGDVHVGMATALPTGNLIVPVVKNAATLQLPQLAAEVNRLAHAARTNALAPEDVKGSTFTISNVGTFGSLMGTPIINQPEAAIIAFGIIKKRPEVITTSYGDEIAIRSMMFLSLSFDHRIIDGYLGGSFLKRVGDYLEEYNTESTT